MKKAISMLVVLCMVLSMSVGAFAAGISGILGTPDNPPATGDNADVAPPHVHEFTVPVEGKEATCTEDGYKAYKKCVCGEEPPFKAVIPAKGHEYSIKVAGKEATCTEEGYSEHTMCACGAKSLHKVIPAKGHTLDKEVVKEATCTEGGSVREYCTVCGMTVGYAIIPATGHEKLEKTEPATCTKDGLYHVVCTKCDELLLEEVIPATGHEKLEKTEPATCTKDGLYHVVCTNCDELLLEEVIPATGHTYVDGKCECGAIDPETPTVDVEEEKPTVVSKTKYYTVKAEAGLHGTISPEGTFEVREGKDKTFKITANEGYVIDVLTVDRKEVVKASGEEKYTLTLEDIDEDYNIKVSFVKVSVPTSSDKANPDTGASDFVGVAVALAVVSSLGMVSLKKRR